MRGSMDEAIAILSETLRVCLFCATSTDFRHTNGWGSGAFRKGASRDYCALVVREPLAAYMVEHAAARGNNRQECQHLLGQLSDYVDMMEQSARK